MEKTGFRSIKPKEASRLDFKNKVVLINEACLSADFGLTAGY
jgi:hypothetical protein